MTTNQKQQNFSLTFAANVDLNLSINRPAHGSMESVLVDCALGGNYHAVFSQTGNVFRQMPEINPARRTSTPRSTC